MPTAKCRLIVLLLLVLIGLATATQQVVIAEEEGLGGGGPLPALLFFDLEDLNTILSAAGYAPLPETALLMGGGGFGGLVEGLRFGGLGFGGEISAASGEREAALEFGFGGFLIERGLSSGERYSLALGAVIGGGDARLTLRERRPGSFAEAIANPPNVSLTRGFFALQAHLGVELFVLDWLMLKVNLGYLWTFSEPWKLGQAELPGPPESFSAPLVQVLVSFGGRGGLEEEEEPAHEGQGKGKARAEAEPLERGRFTIEQLETAIGYEDFVLGREPDGTLRLFSQVTLTPRGQQLALELELRLTSGLAPLAYLGRVSTPQGVQQFGAELAGNRARLYTQAGGQAQEKIITSDEPFVLFDNNQNGQLLVLYQLVAGLAEGEEARFTALVPQALASFPLRVRRAGTVTLEAAGEEVQAERFILDFAGGTPVEMYVSRGQVIGSAVPDQAALFYRQDLFPEGFRVSWPRAELPQGVQETELTFTSAGLRLVGTLTLPEGPAGPLPGVLFLHGSGPVDRDENAPGLRLDLFNVLAWRLAQAGIASFRYDKRGVGESEGLFSKASMADLLADARAALALLKGQKEVDPQRIFILGHSEGGILGPLLAADAASGVAGLILIAAPAHPLDWIIIEQVRRLAEAMGLPPEQVEERVEEQRQFVRFVKETQGDWEDCSFEQMSAYFPWLTEEDYRRRGEGTMSLHWFREHFAHDPLAAIRKVKVPVLIIHGAKDLQVPPGEGELLAAALREAGNLKVRLELLPDLNHLLRYQPEPPSIQYQHLDEPVDERVLGLISDWAGALSQSLAKFAQLEKAIQEELAAAGTPGAALALVRGEEVIYAKGFGLADIETGAPVTPEMLFRIGSLTKPFTAAALVTLAEAGRFALDAPIGEYIDGPSPKLAELSAHQLLTHTAGLRDEAPSFGPHDESALAETVLSWTDDYLFTEPGEVFSYANPGYALAGLLLEGLGEKPYATLIGELLLEPLGMTRTTFQPTLAMTYPLAQGHRLQAEGPTVVVRPYPDHAGFWPAGFLISNVFDLARFAIAFMNGGLIEGRQALAPGVIAKLATPYAEVPGSAGHYGYGLFIREYRGLRVVEHGGAIAGFSSILKMVPEQQFAVIILANGEGARLEAMAEKALELFLPLEPEIEEERPALPLSTAELSSYVGLYVQTPALEVELFTREGQLFGRAFGAEFPVTKIGERHFSAPVPGWPAPLEFVLLPGPEGEIKYLHALGRALRRLERPEPGPESSEE